MHGPMNVKNIVRLPLFQLIGCLCLYTINFSCIFCDEKGTYIYLCKQLCLNQSRYQRLTDVRPSPYLSEEEIHYRCLAMLHRPHANML